MIPKTQAQACPPYSEDATNPMPHIPTRGTRGVLASITRSAGNLRPLLNDRWVSRFVSTYLEHAALNYIFVLKAVFNNTCYKTSDNLHTMLN